MSLSSYYSGNTQYKRIPIFKIRMNLSEARVLQIINYFYPHIGGEEQVGRDIAGVLRQEKVNQKIICFNENAFFNGFSTHREETVIDTVDDVEVIRCGCIAKKSSQSISLTFPRELQKIMDSFQPNIVIFHYPNPLQAEFLLKYKKRNFKLVLYWHFDITKQKFLKKLFYFQNRLLISRANVVVGATPMHIDESSYSKYFHDKKKILPYQINEQNLQLDKREIEYAGEIRKKYDGKVLGFFIGRHVPYKGLTYLLKASKELTNEKIHLLIAGDGELTDKLKEESKGDEKVEFLGRITDSEKRSYLSACDIICFPSITRNEGFGLSLAEGMYFGHPAVTFHITGSGVNYINLDGITGIECPNADYHAYAVALKSLCENETLRNKYGNAARKRVMEEFTSISFQKNIKELIMEL